MKHLVLFTLVGVASMAHADLELLRCTAQGAGQVVRATVAFDTSRAQVGDLLLESVPSAGGASLSSEQGFVKLVNLPDGGVQFRVGDPTRRDHLAVRITVPRAGSASISFWSNNLFNYNSGGTSPGVTICSRTSINGNRPPRKAECLESPRACLDLLTP